MRVDQLEYVWELVVDLVDRLFEFSGEDDLALLLFDLPDQIDHENPAPISAVEIANVLFGGEALRIAFVDWKIRRF